MSIGTCPAASLGYDQPALIPAQYYGYSFVRLEGGGGIVTNAAGNGGLPTGDLRESLTSFSAHDSQVARVLASTAWITPVIVGVNVAIFLAMSVAFGTIAGFDPLQLAAWGGNSGTLDLSGQWWRLVTYQFLHVNLPHIVINMWVLWNVGRLTERLYGSVPLLFLYLCAGALAGLASIMWNPAQISVGASGSIFGVLGAFLAFLLRARDEAPSSVLRYWLPVLLFVAYNLFAGATQPGVDNAAHVGGLIAGFGLGTVLVRPLGSRQSFPLAQISAAVLLAGACALPPLWYLGAFDRRPSALETFATAHRWYMDGEGANLRLWETLAGRINAGSISNDEARGRFERDILPFWSDADARFRRELTKAGRRKDPFLAHVANFAALRLGWAQAIVAALRDTDPQHVQTALDFAQRTNLEQAAIDRLKLRDEAERLPTPLSESAVAIWIKSRAPMLQRKCVDAPAGVRRPPSPTDAFDDGPAQRHAMGCLAQQLFMAGDYATLDATMKRYARNPSDLPDGGSRFEGMWDGLDDLLAYGAIPVEDAMRRTVQWRRSVKGSGEPDVAEALMFRIWAYTARGYGYASSVNPQAFQLYLSRSAMAAAALQDAKPAAGNDPMWYALSLGVDRDQSVSLDKQRALFDRGVEKFPGYLPLYRQMLTSLMPRWGGSTDAVDRFIRDVATKNGQMDIVTYTRLYMIYGDLEGEDFNVFVSSNADPIVLRQGMKALIRRYPGSDYIVNSVARFACINNDPPAYRAVRQRLQGHESASAWPHKLSVARCDALTASD